MTRLDSMAFGGEVHSLFMNGDCLINIKMSLEYSNWPKKELKKELPKLFRQSGLSACPLGVRCRDSVATAIADIFRNNGISMGRDLAKVLKIFEKID
jgi:hypothetical protein